MSESFFHDKVPYVRVYSGTDVNTFCDTPICEGNLILPILSGLSLHLDRTKKNGLKAPGLWKTSKVKRVFNSGKESNAKYIETESGSFYKIVFVTGHPVFTGSKRLD